MKRILSTFIGVLLLIPHVSAQNATPPEQTQCAQQIQYRLARDQDEFRKILFGLPHAAEENIGAVRYDKAGDKWVKLGSNSWRYENLLGKPSGTNISNQAMDDRTYRDPLSPEDSPFRMGIFETKGVMTSELIPPLTQSYRALQCRVLATCQAALMSLQTTTIPKDYFNAIVPGCRQMPTLPLTMCIRTPDKTTLPIDAAGEAFVRTYCLPLAEALVNREAEVLKLAVTYDAAYRTLLQFSGNFDGFLKAFRIDVLRPMEDSLSLLQSLSRIPCFAAQCNE